MLLQTGSTPPSISNVNVHEERIDSKIKSFAARSGMKTWTVIPSRRAVWGASTSRIAIEHLSPNKKFRYFTEMLVAIMKGYILRSITNFGRIGRNIHATTKTAARSVPLEQSVLQSSRISILAIVIPRVFRRPGSYSTWIFARLFSSRSSDSR